MTSRRLERALSRSTIAVPETAGAEVPGSRTWIDRVVDPLHTWLQGTDGSVSLYAVIGRVREMGGSVPAALLMFKEVDTDGDGQLSSMELRAGLARAAHDPALQLLVQLAAACPNDVAPAVAAVKLPGLVHRSGPPPLRGGRGRRHVHGVGLRSCRT